MEYKEVVGFPYFITSEGIILNSKLKVRQPGLKRSGYHQVTFKSPSKDKTYLVHRLVALTFIPNPLNKPFVNHINGIKTDNRVENLEWVTHQENMDHAKRTGLIPIAEENGNSILTSSQVEEICKLLQDGCRNIEIADYLGISQFIISAIRRKECWNHISCKYEIPERSRTLSIETFQWIYEKIKEGLTVRQILDLANNPRINKDTVKDIKRGRYNHLVH